jgi:F-type H+-transporting ATPase subunit b
MDKLFTPDFGLMVWTVVTFVLLLIVLGKFGWGPMIAAIAEREAAMKAEREGAEAARKDAERIKAEMESEMAKLTAKNAEMLAKAQRDSENLRAELKASAESEAQKIREKTLAELAEEKRRLVTEIRKEVSDLSVLAAEKLMRKSVDDGVQKSVLDQFFKDIEKQKLHN